MWSLMSSKMNKGTTFPYEPSLFYIIFTKNNITNHTKNGGHRGAPPPYCIASLSLEVLDDHSISSLSSSANKF